MSTTIRLPGAFLSFFEGTAVIQGEQNTGYPAAAIVRRAYEDGERDRIRRGRIISVLMTFHCEGQDLTDSLDCVDAYAATCEAGALDVRGENRHGTPEYNEANQEIAAARRVRERVARARTELANA